MQWLNNNWNELIFISFYRDLTDLSPEELPSSCPLVINDENDNKVAVTEQSSDSESNKEDKITDTTEPPKLERTSSLNEKEGTTDTIGSSSPTLKIKLEKLEGDLRMKCDKLKSEFEAAKKLNQLALEELHRNKVSQFIIF